MVDVVFSWSGLPQYAAREIKNAVDRLNDIGLTSAVIGTRPNVPVMGMEKVLDKKIIWIEKDKVENWSDIGISCPKYFIQSGWSDHRFNRLGYLVKQRGGRVIGLADNQMRGDFRQIFLGSIYFRMKFRSHFDAMLVPGNQGMKLMRWFGVRDPQIRTGLYGADPKLFTSGPSLTDREKNFLYVGRFVHVKNIVNMVEAFIHFNKEYPDWKLQLVGDGELRHKLPQHNNVIIHQFVQPECLSDFYHKARFFVLASLKEPWGLVVHEAALSGCALILSDKIGSGDDLAKEGNSIRFRAHDQAELVQAFCKAARFDNTSYQNAQNISLELASHYGPNRFGEEIYNLIDDFRRGIV